MKTTTSFTGRWLPLIVRVSSLFLLFMMIGYVTIRVSARSTSTNPESLQVPETALIGAAGGLTGGVQAVSYMIREEPDLRTGLDGSNNTLATVVPLQNQNLLDGAVFELENRVASRVFIPGILNLTVVQQPEDQDVFVSTKKNILTQFRQPQTESVTGILAHNYLAGSLFYKLEVGQPVWVTYGENEVHRYRVTSIHKFKKVTPGNLSSNLIDIETKQELTSSQIYDWFYRGSHKVTFQTCLEGEGRLDWGLTFIVAEPDLP